MFWRAKRLNPQHGITVLETAAVAFVLATLSYVIFTLGQVWCLRHEVDRSVETMLHLQNHPLMHVSYSANGDISYETHDQVVTQTATSLLDYGEALLKQSSFLQHRPYKLEAAIIFSAVDERDGSFRGFESMHTSVSRGSLQVPAAVTAHISVAQTLEAASHDTTRLQSLAESSMGIIYDEHDTRFVPRLPLKVVCLYVQDTGSIRALFGSTTLPEGIIAQCDIKKGRTIL